MKIIKLLIAILIVVGVSACGGDEGTNPVFKKDEVYIYDNKPQTATAVQGEEFIWEMVVAPNDGSVLCRWLVDGAVVLTEQNLTFTFDIPGKYTLRFEAIRGKTINYREFQLTVSPAP